MLFLLFGAMLILMLLGMRIGLAMVASSLLYLLFHLSGPLALPLGVIPQKMLYGVDSFPLLAVPLFMLAGELMSAGGITTRIVRFATALVGWITGGLAHVVIVVNMIMAGMSGSAVADAAATGSILIPAMVKARFPPAFAAAVTAAAATIGPIIPPSIPFVLIGTIGQISIGRLFLGGAIPGVLMGLFLMAASYRVAKRQSYAIEKRADIAGDYGEFLAGDPCPDDAIDYYGRNSQRNRYTYRSRRSRGVVRYVPVRRRLSQIVSARYLPDLLADGEHDGGHHDHHCRGYALGFRCHRRADGT